MNKPKQTPTILQMEATECGAVALAIILAYYGRYVPIEEMRIICGVSRDGSNAANILKAARKFGLKATGAKIEPEVLKTFDTFPIILFWRMNHFVVLEGFQDDKIYINDPGRGRYQVDWNEFDRSYTGVALLFEKETSFQRGGETTSLWKILSTRLKHVRLSLFYIVIVSIFLSFVAITIAGFTKIFIDNILIQQEFKSVFPLISVMLLTGIIQAVLIFLQRYHLLRLQYKILNNYTLPFLWHVFHLPLQFYQQRFSGDIGDRINANDRLSTLLSNELSAGIVGIIMMLFFAIAMMLFDWQLTIVGITSSIIVLFLLVMISKKIADLNFLFLQEKGRFLGNTMNNVSMIEVIKANSLSDTVFERYAGQHANIIDYQNQIAMYNQFITIAAPTIFGLTIVFILGLGSIHIMDGRLTIGSFIAFQTLLLFFNQPLMILVTFATNLQNIRGDINRSDDIMNCAIDERYLIKDDLHSSIERKSCGVQIENLSFSYSQVSPPILKNINMTINPGEFIGLIGKSGSGKSTLAKLLCGLYRSNSNSILIDSKNMNEISAANLSRLIGMVEQEHFLMAGRVLENMTFWREGITEDNVKDALVDACIWDELKTRGGVFAPVLEGGSNFSGGERQRLEIARAIVHNPAVLILDEATAALERSLEKTILKNLRNRQWTLIVITYRLDMLKQADQIYVLDNGSIVEKGKHDDLIKNPNSFYLKLLKYTKDDND